MNGKTIDLGKIAEPFLVEQLNMILLPFNCEVELPDNAKLVTLRGHAFYAAPNTPQLSSLLYSAGYPLSSPIYFDEDYDWSDVQIYEAQAQMAGLLTCRRRAYNLSAMGTGKTIGSLLAIDWLIERGHIEQALIVAPLTILWTVWQDEIRKHFPRLHPVILHGAKEKRLKLLAMNSWNVAIINHEGVQVVQQQLMDKHFGMVLIDEAATYRDAQTAKWKVMKKVVEQASFVSALTGSPTPNAPSDAYGLARLITPENCPRSFTAFRHSVEYEMYPGRWMPRKDAAEKVAKLLQPAVRFKRSDIIELKDVFMQTQRVLLSSEQSKALTELKKESMVRFPEGIVDAMNAAVMVGKALQICAGAVYTSDKNVVHLHPQHRIETTETIIDSAEGKVIVLAPFLHVTAMLAERLRQSYKIAVVTGAVATKDRSSIFRRFQDKQNPLRVLVAHPRVLAHGLNLTTANVIVWFSPLYSREIYEQANARITRLGQSREQFIIHLSAGADEDAVYKALETKGKVQNVILDMFGLKMENTNTRNINPLIGLE